MVGGTLFKWLLLVCLLLTPNVYAQDDNNKSFITILPDSPLWQIDILFEDVHIAVVRDSHQKAQLRVKFALERLEEINELGALNDDASNRMDDLIFQTHNDLNEIGSCVSGKEVLGANTTVKINQECETKYKDLLLNINVYSVFHEEVRLNLIAKAKIYNDNEIKNKINLRFMTKKQKNDELISKIQEKVSEVRREKINKGVEDLDDIWERPDTSRCNAFKGIPFTTVWINDKGLELPAKNSCEAHKFSDMGWKLKIDKR
tara:strand:+ start:938 stop:1717 length:780 start_codon:yes stop_codon:yes gene_type:complete